MRFYINGSALRISPDKAGGTEEGEKWKKMKKETEEREELRWGFNGWLSISSNLGQEEAIFFDLDGWINEAFHPFISV